MGDQRKVAKPPGFRPTWGFGLEDEAACEGLSNHSFESGASSDQRLWDVFIVYEYAIIYISFALRPFPAVKIRIRCMLGSSIVAHLRLRLTVTAYDHAHGVISAGATFIWAHVFVLGKARSPALPPPHIRLTSSFCSAEF